MSSRTKTQVASTLCLRQVVFRANPELCIVQCKVNLRHLLKRFLVAVVCVVKIASLVQHKLDASSSSNQVQNILYDVPITLKTEWIEVTLAYLLEQQCMEY